MFNHFIVWVFVFDWFFLISKILSKIDLTKGNSENSVLCQACSITFFWISVFKSNRWYFLVSLMLYISHWMDKCQFVWKVCYWSLDQDCNIYLKVQSRIFSEYLCIAMPRRHRVLLGRARVYGPDIGESRARLRPVTYAWLCKTSINRKTMDKQLKNEL